MIWRGEPRFSEGEAPGPSRLIGHPNPTLSELIENLPEQRRVELLGQYALRNNTLVDNDSEQHRAPHIASFENPANTIFYFYVTIRGEHGCDLQGHPGISRRGGGGVRLYSVIS